MARKILGFVLILAAVAAIPAGAQLIGRTATVTTLPACNGTKQMALVTDATNATTLGAGGGSASVWVSCATGSWAIEEVAAVSDLTGYVQDSEAAQVSIEASGAGNDVTLIAADDVLLTPGDDFVVTPTAGSSIINAVGAGEDVSLVAADDIIHVANDYSGTFAATWSAIATSFTFSGGDFSAQSADTGSSINVQDQNVELTSDGEISFQGPTRMNDGTAPAVACSVQMKGIFYFDTDINKTCVCNGTDYVLMNDDTTTTGCS